MQLNCSCELTCVYACGVIQRKTDAKIVSVDQICDRCGFSGLFLFVFVMQMV